MEVWSKAEPRVQVCVDVAGAMMCEHDRVKSGPRAWSGHPGQGLGRGAVMQRILYEELRSRFDKEELAQLLGMNPGVSRPHVEEDKRAVVMILSREPAVAVPSPNAHTTESPRPQAERKSWL
jgi:hypothetical protein